MSYKVFNAQNTGQRHRLIPTISFHREGRIVLNGAAFELLNEPSALEFMQDEQLKKDWYIRSASEETGFLVRKNSTHRSKMIVCSWLANELMDSIDFTEKIVYFSVAKEPSEIEGNMWHAIITANPKSKKR